MIKKIKNWFSAKKLKQKVKYLFLVIIAAYMIFFLAIYLFFFRHYVIRNSMDSNRKTMTSIGNNLTSELNTINSMSQLIMLNSNVTAFLDSKEKNPRNNHNAIYAMYDISNSFDNVDSIYLFNSEGSYINIANGITSVNRRVMKDNVWYKQVADAKGGFLVRINGGGAFYKKGGETIISFLRVVNEINTQKPVGLMVINLSLDLLKDTYKDMPGNFSYCYENRILLCREEERKELEHIKIMEEEFSQNTVGHLGNEKVWSYYHIPDLPFAIICTEKISLKKLIPARVIWIVIGLFIITVLSLAIFGIFISVYITSPIERLVQSMDIAKRGWLRRVSLSLPNDEIGHLKDSYNEMLVAINQLISELIEKEKAMQKAELDVLQEQIKPHFLYNTLESIAYIALQESKEKVYNAIETLGNFYRKFLSSGAREITIREETGIIKDYLTLQKLRYEDTITDEYEIQEDLLDIRIPKLILQPLVENSIYHGIRLKGEDGIIKISIFSKEKQMHIIVFDNGIGMNEKQLSEIMLENSKSFGLKGTIERIKYYYNREDVYEIRSEEGRYTEIEIKIPLQGEF